MNKYNIRFCCVGKDDCYVIEVEADSKKDVWDMLMEMIDRKVEFMADAKRMALINLHNIEAIFVEDLK